MPESELGVLAVDTVVGDDGQMPGLAQPVTLDEIRDVVFEDTSVEARLEKLRQMKSDFQTRNMADVEGGFDHYIAEIDRGIDELTGGADGSAEPSVLDNVDHAASFDEDSAVDDPDGPTTRTASGSVSSDVDLDAGHTPEGEPTVNPASRID